MHRLTLAATILGALCANGCTHTRTEPSAMTDAGLDEQVARIHRAALLIDGHNDLPGQIREHGGGSFDVLDISRSQPALHTDIPRLRAGGVGGQFWSAYVPPHLHEEGGATRYALEQIDLIHRMAARYPDDFELAWGADDVERIHRSGKIACLVGVEGGHAIESSLGVLRMFERLGVRYITLTHADTHDWADSATDDPQHGGLSPFGEDVVREMNRLGILVDISHVSADAMRDVLRVSTAPVIASHSSAHAVAAHPRNVPDDVLEMIRDNGGVVMVNFFSGFVHPESARVMLKMFDVYREMRATYGDDEEKLRAAREAWRAENPYPDGDVGTVVDHIDHIVRVAGIDHVGLGSDFDGVSRLPKGLEDVSGYPNITRELVRRGYAETEIRKILGGNVLRALRGAERVRDAAAAVTK